MKTPLTIVCDICGVAPCETPAFCEASRIAERARYHQEKCEPPRPLMRELPPADAYPVDALGDVLAAAARAINDRIQAPLAICGQSVLAAATLATQAHADVMLPMGHARPLSSYYVTVAATGERKSAVDQEALWAVRAHEAALRKQHASEALTHRNAADAYESARRAAAKKCKEDRDAIRHALDALGPAPKPPLEPVLTCPEPTYEGLIKLLAVGQPSVGLFAAEGGQFIGGHGMSDDAKLRTAAGLSSLWDGEPIKRIRALDGVTVLPGRRVAMHLMVQPDVAAIWFSDRLLIEQGLLSRALVTAPDSTSGTRLHRKPRPDSDTAVKHYGARLLDILERPLAFVSGTHNELAARVLPLSDEAQRLLIAFADHVEQRLGPGGELEAIRGFANKLPEHAARLAAVLTLTDNIEAGAVGTPEMEAGILLAQHYATEAMRLHGASRVSAELHEAERLRIYLLTAWREPRISLPDIYQRGPASIREATRARHAVTILADHGWLIPAGPGEVDRTPRRETWRIREAKAKRLKMWFERQQRREARKAKWERRKAIERGLPLVNPADFGLDQGD